MPDSPTAPLSRELVSKLDRKHPEWEKYHDAWDSLRLMFRSGVDLKSAAADLLVRRPKEPNDVFAERCRRFYSQPILGPITMWYSAKLFQREPQIDIKGGDAKFWEEWELDVDRAGTSFIQRAKSLMEDWIVYGRSYHLVDLPKLETPPESLADQKELGADRAYLVRFDPSDVINWADDDFGNMKWCVIKVATREQDGPLDPVSTWNNWYVYDQQNYRIYRRQVSGDGNGQDITAALTQATGESTALQIGNGADGAEFATLVSEGQHALAHVNRVPIRRYIVDDGLWLGNRAYTLLGCFINDENVLAWALFMSNLAMPVIVTGDELNAVSIAEYSYLHLKDPQSKVFYFQPNPDTFKISADRLDRLREELYRTFYLQAQARNSSATAQSASGVSKQEDMAPANDVLNTYGDAMIQAMQSLVKDTGEARNEPVTCDVSGFRFEVRPALADVEVGDAMLSIGVADYSDTAEKAVIENVCMSYFEDRNQDFKDKVRKEIQASPTKEERMQQQQDQQVAMYQQSISKATDRAGAKQIVSDEAQAA